MKNQYELTPEQRVEYSRHLMPCFKLTGGLPLKGGEGIYLVDLDGKKYMDFTSEQFVCLLGFGNREVAEAIYEQALCMPMVAPLHQTDLRYSLYHKLASIAPPHLNRISFTLGGGLAIESAMKIALKNVPGSQNFITCMAGITAPPLERRMLLFYLQEEGKKRLPMRAFTTLLIRRSTIL